MTLPDDVNIECTYQKGGRGTLVCQLAGEHSFQGATDEVAPEICYHCPIGKINRELGCNKISGKVSIFGFANISGEGKELKPVEISLWCNLRNRAISYEKCLICPNIGNQFTAPTLKKTLDYFEMLGFNSAKENLEKAREHLLKGNPQGSITNSISAVESTFKSILDILRTASY